MKNTNKDIESLGALLYMKDIYEGALETHKGIVAAHRKRLREIEEDIRRLVGQTPKKKKAKR